jgi:hypothetical protein
LDEILLDGIHPSLFKRFGQTFAFCVGCDELKGQKLVVRSLVTFFAEHPLSCLLVSTLLGRKREKVEFGLMDEHFII